MLIFCRRILSAFFLKIFFADDCAKTRIHSKLPPHRQFQGKVIYIKERKREMALPAGEPSVAAKQFQLHLKTDIESIIWVLDMPIELKQNYFPQGFDVGTLKGC